MTGKNGVVLLLTTVIFFVPSCILGMVTPLVVKQALTSLGNAGSLVGRIYAVSTAGSLLGVYLTGFVLIAQFGTRLIMIIVASILLVLGVLFGNLLSNRSIGASIFLGGITLQCL